MIVHRKPVEKPIERTERIEFEGAADAARFLAWYLNDQSTGRFGEDRSATGMGAGHPLDGEFGFLRDELANVRLNAMHEAVRVIKSWTSGARGL